MSAFDDIPYDDTKAGRFTLSIACNRTQLHEQTSNLRVFNVQKGSF